MLEQKLKPEYVEKLRTIKKGKFKHYKSLNALRNFIQV